jgi:hypothetical protein
LSRYSPGEAIISISAIKNAGRGMRGASNIKPMRHERRASISGTLQSVTSTLIALNFNLAAREDTFAHDADAFVIQRIPFPDGIGAAENVETFFGLEMFMHSFRLPIEHQSEFARRMQSGGTRIAASGKALPMH